MSQVVKSFYRSGTFTSVNSDRWRLLNSLIVAAISDVGSLAWNRKQRKPMNNKEPKAYISNKLLLPEQEQQLPTVDLVPRSQGQPVSRWKQVENNSIMICWCCTLSECVDPKKYIYIYIYIGPKGLAIMSFINV